MTTLKSRKPTHAQSHNKTYPSKFSPNAARTPPEGVLMVVPRPPGAHRRKHLVAPAAVGVSRQQRARARAVLQQTPDGVCLIARHPVDGSRHTPVPSVIVELETRTSRSPLPLAILRARRGRKPFRFASGRALRSGSRGQARAGIVDFIEAIQLPSENLLFKRLKVWPLVTERLFGNQSHSFGTVRGEQVLGSARNNTRKWAQPFFGSSTRGNG